MGRCDCMGVRPLCTGCQLSGGRERWELVLSFPPSSIFIQQATPAMREHSLHSEWLFPPQIDPFRNIFADMQRYVFKVILNPAQLTMETACCRCFQKESLCFGWSSGYLGSFWSHLYSICPWLPVDRCKQLLYLLVPAPLHPSPAHAVSLCLSDQWVLSLWPAVWPLWWTWVRW